MILVYVSRIPALNINLIEISGNKVLETEKIKGVAEKEIFGKYFWLFPKTNVLYYSKNNIEKSLTQQFKRIENININVNKNRALQISIIEREALYTWCGTTIVETENQKCYFLDKNGYIFDEAPYFSGEVYFKFYGAIQDFQKLILFKEKLETIRLRPVALQIVSNGDITVFLSNGSLKQPEIILKANADLNIIAENIETALTTEPLQSNFKNKYSSLEYLDLRYGNKVYSRFR